MEDKQRVIDYKDNLSDIPSRPETKLCGVVTNGTDKDKERGQEHEERSLGENGSQGSGQEALDNHCQAKPKRIQKILEELLSKVATSKQGCGQRKMECSKVLPGCKGKDYHVKHRERKRKDISPKAATVSHTDGQDIKSCILKGRARLQENSHTDEQQFKKRMEGTEREIMKSRVQENSHVDEQQDQETFERGMTRVQENGHTDEQQNQKRMAAIEKEMITDSRVQEDGRTDEQQYQKRMEATEIEMTIKSRVQENGHTDEQQDQERMAAIEESGVQENGHTDEQKDQRRKEAVVGKPRMTKVKEKHRTADEQDKSIWNKDSEAMLKVATGHFLYRTQNPVATEFFLKSGTVCVSM